MILIILLCFGRWRLDGHGAEIVIFFLWLVWTQPEITFEDGLEHAAAHIDVWGFRVGRCHECLTFVDWLIFNKLQNVNVYMGLRGFSHQTGFICVLANIRLHGVSVNLNISRLVNRFLCNQNCGF